MRFKNVKHAEYEILRAILHNPNNENFIVSIEKVRERGIPKGDEVAEKRFTQSVASIGTFLTNMMERRKHRLPKNHPDYQVK